MEAAAVMRTKKRLYKDEIHVVVQHNPNRKGWTILNKSTTFKVRLLFDTGFMPMVIPPGSLLEVPLLEYIGRVRAEVLDANEPSDYADIDVCDFVPLRTDTDGRVAVT